MTTPGPQNENLKGSGRPGVRIRPMILADIDEVVGVHLSAFPSAFLTFLGPRFLRLFYAEAIKLREISLVALEVGRPVGLATGSVQPANFFRAVLRRRALAFALAALPGVLRRPSIAPRVARALSKPREAAKPDGTATLLSLGVSADAQKAGVGRSLVKAFLEEAARRGAKKADLTTDKLDNQLANAFYLSLGFQVVREIVTPEHRILNEYEISLEAGSAIR